MRITSFQRTDQYDLNQMYGSENSTNFWFISISDYQNKPVEAAGVLMCFNLYGVHLIQTYIATTGVLYIRVRQGYTTNPTWTDWQQV